MPEYRITIKSEADLKAAKQLEDQLKKVIEATKKTGGETKHLEAQMEAAKKAVNSEAAALVNQAKALNESIKLTKQLGTDSKALEQQLSHTNAALGKRQMALRDRFTSLRDTYREGYSEGGMIGGGLAVAGLMSPKVAAGLAVAAVALKAGTKGLQEYATAEKEVFKLNAALAQRGQLTEEYSGQLQDLASAQQRATGISDEDWLRAITNVTKNGATPESIGRLVRSVEDLAGLMDGDIVAASTMMSKAIQGNFQMLSRWGIKVDENATQAEKLDQAMRAIAARGAGQLRAGAEGLDGAFRRVKLSAGDLWENFGNGLNRALMLDKALNAAADGMGWLAQQTFRPIQTSKSLVNSIDTLPEILEDAAKGANKSADGFKKLGDEFERVQAKADLAKAAIDRTKGAEDAEAAARMKLEMAQVDDDVARGKISATQGNVRKAGIEQRFAREAALRAERADEERKRINVGVLAELQQNEQLTAAAIAGVQSQMVPESQIAAARARHDGMKADRSQILSMLDGLEGAQRFGKRLGFGALTGGLSGTVEQLRARLAELDSGMSREGKFLSSATARNTGAQANLDSLTALQADQAIANEQTRARLMAENAGITAGQQSRSRLFALDSKTRATQLGTELFEARNDPKAVEEIKLGLREIRKQNAEMTALTREFVSEILLAGIQNKEDYERMLAAINEIRSIQKKTNRQ